MSRDPDEPEAVETQIKTYARVVRQPQPRIKWRDSEGPHEFLLHQRAMLGSAPSADIVIADKTVSRIHAEFEVQDDGTWVRDLGSRNGTFVAGIRVNNARVPVEGTVRVGSTDLEFDSVVEASENRFWPSDRFGRLIGKSRAMRELFHDLASIASSDASALIRGETGTGKEVVARSIHEASTRSKGPFIVVDCGAIPENLIESELFGSAKGAFTGAQTARTGAIEAADGGTVFFDEIGELPLAMQPKLLRVLESREIRRLGENFARKIDVRFLSASHRDLRQMVNVGGFREDLYFRLAVLPVTIPPLRERPEDVGQLVKHFLPPGAEMVSPDLLEELTKRPWLGNVRELRNFVERAVAVGMDRALRMSAAPRAQRDGASDAARAPALAGIGSPPVPRGQEMSGMSSALPIEMDQAFKTFREQWLELGEKEYVRQLLTRHNQKVAAAADAAGLDRTYLYRLIRKHLR